MSQLLLVLISLSLLEASASSSTSRSILREIKSEIGGEGRDYAVDLNGDNIDSVLNETSASYVIVEFYAKWCPSCRNYKPHYEKVARLFNGPEAVHPGIVLMARVDCASRKNTKLCFKFTVNEYPLLLWGPPQIVADGWDPRRVNTEIRVIDDGKTADRLLNWINNRIGSSYRLDDQKLGSNISDFGQIAWAVFDVEEATATAFNIILDLKMIKTETRASLIKFLQLLAAHHPSRRCRKGSADILVNFGDLFPPDMLSLDKMEDDAIANKKGAQANLQICGKEFPRGYWMFCRGSRNDTRGFSCGLWILLHSLSVRIEDGESQYAFTAICDFVQNFFVCEECRQHFHEMCSSVSTPFKKARDLALWLWSAHNQVNERLMKVEASLGTGDPEFPKMVWPPKDLCSLCSLGQNDWNWDEVFGFLTRYYGKTLVSSNKDKGFVGNEGTEKVLAHTTEASTSTVVVPVGAAIAIAISSCAFGALACYWRSRQKKRKYHHQRNSYHYQRNSLKNFWF